MTEGRQNFDRMVELLQEERRAIGQLDTARLAALVEEKEALVNAMMEEAPYSEDNTTPVARVLAEAHANALLLETAIDLLSEHLGQTTQSPIYDQQGRVHRSPGSAARTQI